MGLAGQVVEENSGDRAIDLTNARVELRRADVAVGVSSFDMAVGITNAGGAFGIVGLAAGRYAITLTPDPSRVPVWMTSATVDGTAGSAMAVEISESTQGPIRITVSPNPTQIQGVVTYTDGRPAAEYTLVAFPNEPGLRILPSPRILTAAPALDGTFTMRGLPTGEYLVGAVGTGDAREIDREMLDDVSGTAQRVSIRPGETIRVSLSIPRVR